MTEQKNRRLFFVWPFPESPETGQAPSPVNQCVSGQHVTTEFDIVSSINCRQCDAA